MYPVLKIMHMLNFLDTFSVFYWNINLHKFYNCRHNVKLSQRVNMKNKWLSRKPCEF